MENIKTTTKTMSPREKALAKVKAMGFNKERSLGMNIQPLNEGDTLLVKITSDITDFTKKNGDELQYIEIDNLETGETGMTLWLSGQLAYTLKSQADGFIGGKFAITHLGQSDADINGKKTVVNNFDVMSISEKN